VGVVSRKKIIMNILLDTSPLDSGHSIRGIGAYTRYLSNELERKKGVSVRRSSAITSGSFHPDVIHFPFFDLFSASLPLLKRKPTIVTIHDVIPLIFPEYYPVGLKGKLAFKKQRVALASVAEIITDSQASKKDIEQFLRIDKNKITVIPLAANPELTPPGKETLQIVREKYALPDTYILYVGDINYNKNIPQLIKSLKFLPEEVCLVLVGKNFAPHDIPEWNWIETQIAMADVAKRIIFISDITSDDFESLSALYTLASVYVQPSLYEGFGLPVLEAMQLYTPVVSANTSSLPEVGGSHALYCEPEAESLATQIHFVLNWKKNDKREWVEAAFGWSKHFSWQKTANMTLDVYKKAMGVTS